MGANMGDSFQTISIVPFDPSLDGDRPSFAEVVAYINGVADALATQGREVRPLSLVPVMAIDVAKASDPRALSGTRPPVAYARITLRFGDPTDPSDMLPVWPRMASVRPYAPTRGGARLLELDTIPPLDDALGSMQRCTYPYGALALSLASPAATAAVSPFPRLVSPHPDSAPPGTDFDRPSGVRLRCAPLSREWYRLTGTESE